ncbi:MAG: c-type cytochrome [Acidobacteria bacterium]|nr:c-type cytochrome [Acidobacteriota bacterium]MBV9475592.1 c-type cytochrome [Acidobacteriota bacterium]
MDAARFLRPSARGRVPAAATIFLFTLTALRCGHSQVPLPRVPAPEAGDASVARGEYLVRNVAVCGGCHSADAKNPDGALAGGKEFRNWRIGVARASNLTSDADTGIGGWTDAELVRAIRNGVRRDGRLLAPVMPYEWFHELSDADAFAIARYLKTLPPVRAEVRQSPNVIFRIGKVLFLRPKPELAVASTPAGANAAYGAYLTQHAALCAECHTPRTGLLQKPDRSRLLAGVPKPPADFPARPSNLTPDSETGIGRWSEADFLRAIRTGKDPEGNAIHPFMPWPELKRMTDDDLRAIYAYLRTLPPTHTAGIDE